MPQYSKYFIKITLPLFLLLFHQLLAQNQSFFVADVPRVVLSDVNFKIIITLNASWLHQQSIEESSIIVSEKKSGQTLKIVPQKFPISTLPDMTLTDLNIKEIGKKKLEITVGKKSQVYEVLVLPPVLSILPAVLAIFFAIITRQVIIALFMGIWLGVTFMYSYNPLLGLIHTVDEYIVKAIADQDRISILVFSLVLGGMVGIISRSGGTRGMVRKLSVYAKTPRLGQLITWFMGILIFFDDYANTLIVGNTMRPLTDKLRISREKLSYIVDSTAAPVANIAIISTWIGYEISLINQSFAAMQFNQNAYLTFLKTIPYNFYPIYALWFGFLIAYLLRDYGIMYRAEIRCRQTGEVLNANATPLTDLTEHHAPKELEISDRWINAFIPIAIVILTVMGGLLLTGYQTLSERNIAFEGNGLIKKISLLIGNADSFAVLMWGAFFGSITAIVLAVSQRIITLQEAIEAWIKGIRSMVMAAIILTAAWTIGMICQELFTAEYVINLTHHFLTPAWLPFITFITAALISFATGTSWGTMAVLMPIAIPMSIQLTQSYASPEIIFPTNILISTTAAVLAGATFGDHCSPISDTTIMSSMASGADHIDHVRTQLPYALTVGLVACVLGYIPVGLGMNNWLALLLGFITIFLIIRFLGKRTDP
jgi:Na+/H+ antiporter NhaC